VRACVCVHIEVSVDVCVCVRVAGCKYVTRLKILPCQNGANFA